MIRKQPSFADYLVIAITPALIILLISSLVFFLLTAFYDGQYQARVRYIFFLFILAAVLIGRIAIEESKEQAVLYGIPLAIATWLALGRFCETNSLVTILMIAVTWWSAHKLTWDCTVIDDMEEAESSGLLQSAGFESSDTTEMSIDPSLDRDIVSDTDSGFDRPNSLRDLWQRWITSRKKPHAPGVWVIYFALATLPLFGIGQRAIRADDLAVRRSAFHCLLIYVASAMSLLGTTSFLGIRRYLRQRRLEMPVDMAMTWAGAVMAIVFAILVVASFLPRPAPEYSISHRVSSRQIDRPSPFSLFKKEGVEPSDDRHADSSSQKTNDPAEHPGRPSEIPSEEGTEPNGPSDESSPSRQDGNSSTGTQGEGTQGEGTQGEGTQGEGTQDPTVDSSDKSRRSEEVKPQDPAEGPERNSSDAPRAMPNHRVNTPSPPPQQVLTPIVQSIGIGIATILRWLYWLIVILAVSYVALRYGRLILDGLRVFFSDIFRLFGRGDSPEEGEGEEAVAESTSSQRTFASFADPTQSGEPMSDRELIRYTFLALEALAADNNCGRTTQETPFEFGKRLAISFPHMKEATGYVVQLYDRMAYANSTPHLSRDRLRQLWQAMRAQHERRGNTTSPR